MRMRHRIAALGIVTVFGLAPAAAQDYPSHPVHIVVGFGPGASGDVTARILAPPLGRLLSQQFVVENRAGAGSSIGTNYVAHAPKDGYTLLLGTVANTITASLMSHQGFDFSADLTPVAFIATQPNIVAVHPATGVTSIAGLIRLARAQPDRLSFGSAGVGTGTHFFGELFNVMAGIKLLHVPYTGSAQAVTDLLGGRVQVMFSPASSVLPHVHEGTLTALASTSAARSGVAPELPTVAESGLPGYDTAGWFGLLAPAGTPHEIVDRLARASLEALKMEDVVAAMQQQGFDLHPGPPEELATYLRDDIAKWKRVAAATGLAR